MKIHWNFKVIATSSEEAGTVLNQIARLLNLNIESHEISNYEKFETQLFSLRVKTVLDDSNATVSDVADQFNRLGTPLFVDNREMHGTKQFEAIFDARKHPSTIPEVFWVSIYAEQPIQ